MFNQGRSFKVLSQGPHYLKAATSVTVCCLGRCPSLSVGRDLLGKQVTGQLGCTAGHWAAVRATPSPFSSVHFGALWSSVVCFTSVVGHVQPFALLGPGFDTVRECRTNCFAGSRFNQWAAPVLAMAALGTTPLRPHWAGAPMIL